MPDNLNILISSTRQWNPGDEFILFGIRNLLEEVFDKEIINWVLYDRNPDLFIDGFKNPLHRGSLWGNSFHGHDPKSIDVAVIAGTPEWFGPSLSGFYKAVREANLPLIVLGAGYIDAQINFTDDEIYCLKNLTRVVTVRDEYAARELNKIGVSHEILPCPALFASSSEKIPSDLKKIGLIIQTDKTLNQSVKEELAHVLLWAVKKLRDAGFNTDIICHYIDEFIEFSRTFENVRYSYDARDYINILNGYDLVISTRVHGAILANSLGKPAMVLHTSDSRIKGISIPFPFIYVSEPNTLLNDLNNIDLSKMNELVRWKKQVKERYLKFLKGREDFRSDRSLA